MAFNPIGVLDLSIVTQLLKDTIDDYWPTAGIWSTLFTDAFFHAQVSGSTPEAVRTPAGGCQLTLSLLHIEPNKSQRNFVYPPAQPLGAPVPRAQQIPALPLALDLYYFVSAYSDIGEGAWQQEQQTLSIVLNCFHQNPILRTTVMFPGPPAQAVKEEFSLTMEIESIDSMSRFWQAITAAFRLSLIYKVAVVFMTPPAPPAPAKPVVRYGLAVGSAASPFAESGQLFGTSSVASFNPPPIPPDASETVSIEYSPATVTPGQTFFLNGVGLNQGVDFNGPGENPGTSYRVFLSQKPDFSDEQDVTSWKEANIYSANPVQTISRIVLTLPVAIGSLPANAPPPGVYSLRSGSSQAAGDATSSRTNTTPFSIAARIDAPMPVLPEVAGTYTFTGVGFIDGGTQVLLDTVPLAMVASAPAAGQFTISAASSITFVPPAALPTGRHTVRVRVNGVESPPALWIGG